MDYGRWGRTQDAQGKARIETKGKLYQKDETRLTQITTKTRKENWRKPKPRLRSDSQRTHRPLDSGAWAGGSGSDEESYGTGAGRKTSIQFRKRRGKPCRPWAMVLDLWLAREQEHCWWQSLHCPLWLLMSNWPSAGGWLDGNASLLKTDSNS